MASYRRTAKEDRAKAIAGVLVVHVALGAIILTAIALPALIPLAGIVGAACASVLAYSATLIVQRRQLRTPGENAVLDVTAGVPPTLDPIA